VSFAKGSVAQSKRSKRTNAYDTEDSDSSVDDFNGNHSCGISTDGFRLTHSFLGMTNLVDRKGTFMLDLLFDDEDDEEDVTIAESISSDSVDSAHVCNDCCALSMKEDCNNAVDTNSINDSITDDLKTISSSSSLVAAWWEANNDDYDVNADYLVFVKEFESNVIHQAIFDFTQNSDSNHSNESNDNDNEPMAYSNLLMQPQRPNFEHIAVSGVRFHAASKARYENLFRKNSVMDVASNMANSLCFFESIKRTILDNVDQTTCSIIHEELTRLEV
jgi:hypothetical protein